LDRSTSVIEDKVLVGFEFEYNTVIETCYENRAIMEDGLLSVFRWINTAVEDEL